MDNIFNIRIIAFAPTPQCLKSYKPVSTEIILKSTIDGDILATVNNIFRECAEKTIVIFSKNTLFMENSPLAKIRFFIVTIINIRFKIKNHKPPLPVDSKCITARNSLRFPILTYPITITHKSQPERPLLYGIGRDSQ